MSEQLHVQISELQGYQPSVPLAEGVDYNALIAGDNDPLFLTLPLLEAGAVSGNGKEYGIDAVQSLVEQINLNKPGGIKGHMTLQERATRFDLPSLMWVGATLHEGKAWGKAYIPRYAADVREYVLKSKARRAKVATSIYGSAVMEGKRARDIQIETIDLADPARAGVKAAVAEPIITSEMNNLEIQEGEMPENSELIAELTNSRSRIQEQLDASREQISELTQRVSLLEQHETTVNALRERIPEGDIVQQVSEMQTAFAEVRRVRLHEQIAEAVTTALGDIAQNERGAQLIREMVGAVDSPQAATARVQELIQRDYVQDMLHAVVMEQAGPSALVGGKGATANWTDQIVADAEKHAAALGINSQ